MSELSPPSSRPAAAPLDVRVLGMHYAPESTGNAPYTTGMVAALAAGGHRVQVVTGYPHYPHWRVADGYRGWRMREADGDVPVTRVRHPVPSSPTALRRIVMDASFALHAALVGGPRPDVVVAVSPVLLTVAAGLRWRRPGRTALGVVTQDLYSRALVETRMASPRAARAGATLERSLLRRADGVVAVHETFASSLAALGVDQERITVIRNWSHTSPPRTDPALTRSRLGWGEHEVIALHAGNMGVKQGLENLVETARLADRTGAAVRLVLLGDGGRRGALEAAAAGVDRLTFLDPLPDGAFEDAMAAADVLVLNEATTVAEMSVPSKLTSYFAAGRPVVAASHPWSAASAEIVRSDGGVRVDPGAPASLLAAVLDLAADPVRARRLGEAGRAYAAANLAPATAAASYCAWVEHLAATRRAPRSNRVEEEG